MRIVVGSKSRSKLSAVRAALAAHGREVVLDAESIPSGIAEQPVDGETREGALNRARGAQKTAEGSWGLGIESGLFCEEGEWRDAAIIVLISPDGRVHEIRSEYLVFPAEVAEIARHRGFETTTAGSVLAEMTGCDGTDPHAYLTGGEKPRAKFLEEALVKLFNQVFNMKEVPMSRVHEVRIGSLPLALPIREVAPGISVALFNPLGDWKVNEEAGKELADKLPKRVDVLIMPDGKAQALLHVIGRELCVPTIVARKEKKPYMGDCVSVDVKSITTDRVQKLYISAEDVFRLRGQRVAIVDDVVSTGATLDAMKQLLQTVGAEYVCTLAVFTEGSDEQENERPDVIALGHLPLY